jgi:gliding motility-associated-like protein
MGCTNTSTLAVSVNIQPKAEFGMTNNPSVAQEPVYFSDFSTPTGAITNWFWQFGDESTATGNAPTHSYANAGEYYITLTVTDNNGCTDTVTKMIDVALLPQVPTAFTPNNDNNNDLLFVKGGPFHSMLFRVYDNWGVLIWETSDQAKGWDGKKNGQDQPVGVYVWTLEVEMYNNRTVKKNGDVTLIR